MIDKIHIQNFKSIYDLEVEVGRVNLFIGENGSGKSNLLEALVFVSASESNKLDNEFLVSRGLRVPEPELMRSAFEKDNKDKEIEVTLYNTKDTTCNIYLGRFNHDNTPYGKWLTDYEYGLEKIIKESNPKRTRKDIENVKGYLHTLPEMNEIKKDISHEKRYVDGEYTIETKFENNNDSYLNNFIIYSPENTSLRIFQKEGQIQPLGINGEGLLKLLQVINNYEEKSYINTIVESLQLFNWFEDITIPTDSLENIVVIKDKYLYREFTQQSANEGFLFILFYITLIVAKETPKAFAIDNIDASLNPKLCTKLMTILVDLAKKYDKQIFLTTHNPAILDGIDLNDEEQKLFVVSRNKQGHTRMKEIGAEDKPKSSTNEPIKLSEAFLRGYLGGLPKGF